MIARRSFLHAIQALASKGQQQEATRGSFVDAAGAKIEKRVLFDLADGGAMRALHIIGINFKLRFGVDLRLIGKKEVAIGLFGVGPLGVFVHDDAPVKNSVGAAVEDAVVELAAATMRLGVLDQHVIVQVLAPVADEKAVD